jgi:hypothetical protein
MAKTVKDTVYLDEDSHTFIQAEVEAGRMNKQRFYNRAIQEAVAARKTEQQKISNYQK